MAKPTSGYASTNACLCKNTAREAAKGVFGAPEKAMSRSDWPVKLDRVYGCWIWTGPRDRDGYGVKWRGNKATPAYRAVYEAERGRVPDGKALDHVCRRRLCVNPSHLEPVSKRENNRRKLWTYRSRQRRCWHGHDLYARGRRTPEGGMVCLDCNEQAGN